MVDVAPAAGIVVFMYLLAEILKHTVLKNSDLVAILPFLCGLCGAIIAVILYYVDPSILGVNDMASSVITGACSGLVATGANQVYKQFYKLTSVGHSVATEVQQEVSNMTTEEKKEYLKDQATNVLENVADKIMDAVNPDDETSEDTPTETASEKETVPDDIAEAAKKYAESYSELASTSIDPIEISATQTGMTGGAEAAAVALSVTTTTTTTTVQAKKTAETNAVAANATSWEVPTEKYNKQHGM